MPSLAVVTRLVLDRPLEQVVLFPTVPECESMKEKPMVSRRHFLETASVATGSVVAASAFPHPAIGSVKGAERAHQYRILGPGGRAQEHIRILNHLKDETKGVDIIGLCDVWDGQVKEVPGGRARALLLRQEVRP